MKRIVSEAKVGEDKTRYRTRIEDDDSPAGSDDSRVRQYLFMHELIDGWPMLSCGMQMFQTFKVFHDGNRWVAELEAISDNPVL